MSRRRQERDPNAPPPPQNFLLREALCDEVKRGAPRRLADVAWDAHMRPTPEDFLVEEIPHYTPCGEGEHLYFHVEKRDASTPQLVQTISQRYGAKERDIGFAGRKDRHGVSRQWISLPARFVDDEGARLVEDERFKLLEVGRHKNKLRLGHLMGNRFVVGVRCAEAQTDAGFAELQSRANDAASRGLPHIFGEQRFFFRPDEAERNVDQALRFVARGHRPRSRRDRFMVSVLQSVVFQHVLRARLADGLFDQCVSGDLLVKTDGRSTFECEDPETDTARLLAGEVSPTGPLVGEKMRSPSGDAMTRESRSLGAFVTDIKHLMVHPAFDSGDRRRLRIFPRDVGVERDGDTIRVSFALPKGAYATGFIRELFGSKTRDGAQDTSTEK